MAALAQGSRMDIFRLLVCHGPMGLPAGEIADRLGVQPATLSFHLTQLSHAGLVTSRRQGRSIIYSAAIETMTEVVSFLLRNCCTGNPDPNDAAPADGPAWPLTQTLGNDRTVNGKRP
nr:metalloregulator ArsR/SmtB family transcription factor [Azospirillum soli]